MNIKIKKFLKNISYSFIANIISMIISVISVVFLPKFMNLEDYGVWQLYLFYAAYLNYFHFGWLDGICLKYGGYYFEKLDKVKFTSQFILLFFVELIISIIGIILINLFIENYFTKQVLLFASYILVPVMIFNFINIILQITNKIKEYVYMNLFGKILFFISLIIYLIINNRSYIELIYLDIISKFLVLFYGIYLIKKLLVSKIDNINNVFEEMKENIFIGSKLLIANIAGVSILGIIRFAISQKWNIEVFGKISFILSCSMFFFVFISAMGMVFFPFIKRMEKSKIRDFYIIMRKGLTIILLGGLLMYYPINRILSWWLPKYQDSLIYMVILLPICIFEGKVSLLINNYLKSLRKEKIMMKINVGVVIISCLLSYISTVLLHDLNIAVISILLLFIIKSVFLEVVLVKILKVQIKRDILEEFILVILFIIINSSDLNIFIKFVGYFMIYIIYLFINKTTLMILLKKIKT